MIGVLDLDLGNLRSVTNAVYSLGFDFRVLRDLRDIDDISHLIIPGVGAYPAVMGKVRERGLAEGIRKVAAEGRPLLGICLGMQILSTWGEEHGETEGLGLIPGRVKLLRPEGGLPVPHVGWNGIEFRRVHPLLRGVKAGVDFYFVHSYQFFCERDEDLLGETDYGGRVAAVVGHGNVVGFQFHPEKSQVNGLKLIENFCDWDGIC